MAESAKLASGDRVILCVSSASGVYAGVHARTREIIDSFGLVPLIYEGVRLRVRESSLDREIRDDFYSAHLIVILLDVKQEEPLSDNWALPEVTHIAERPLLVYASSSASSDYIKKLSLPVDVVLVSGEEEFASQLQNQLRQLMRDV